MGETLAAVTGFSSGFIVAGGVQAHGRYCQTGVRGIEFPGDQITAAVADKIQHDDTLLPRPTGC